jgi:hypothetical protein
LNRTGANTRVDLLVPDLFGPVPMLEEDFPDLPSLSLILARANRHPAVGTDPIRVLFDRFGVEVRPDRDIPSAPFSLLADMPDAVTDGFWLHADPIHLRPDRDRMLLFDARRLDLEREETDSLIELFNGHFAADGLRLEAPVTERWYLRSQESPRIRARPLADVVGRGVERSYLRGEDAAHWMRWLNEAQMLFHHSPVNQRRELAGMPRVSGIWPWGGGFLPGAMPLSRYRSVLAESPLAIGLAKAAQVEVRPLPANLQRIVPDLRSGATLLFWDAPWTAVLDSDAATWVRALQRLEGLLDALVGRLKAGELGELALYPCNGMSFSMTRATLRRFWRRPVSIMAFLRRTPTG